MKYDDKGMKWLRIRNWQKYQPDAKLRNKEARLPWVRDHTAKLENYDYLKLTIFQRGLFEGLCLIAGTRPSRSMPNDPAWIARELHVSRAECAHVPSTLVALQDQGYIIPTNTEKFFEDEDEFAVGDRDREGDREGEGDSSVSQSVSFEGNEKDNKKEELEVLDKEMPVHDLPCFTLLHEEFGHDAQLPENIIRRVHTALKHLGKDEFWMQGCIQYALKHKWWSTRVVNAKTFAGCLVNGLSDSEGKKLPAQYNLFVVKRKSAGAGR